MKYLRRQREGDIMRAVQPRWGRRLSLVLVPFLVVVLVVLPVAVTLSAHTVHISDSDSGKTLPVTLGSTVDVDFSDGGDMEALGSQGAALACVPTGNTSMVCKAVWPGRADIWSQSHEPGGPNVTVQVGW